MRQFRNRVAHRTVAAVLLCVLLAACGGGSGGGGGGNQPPPGPVAFNLIYPGAESLTDDDKITIVGQADPNRVNAVIVRTGNDQVIAQLDGSGNWRATGVPLLPGSNSLVAELTENDGTVTALPITEVESSPVLSYPGGVQFDATNNRVLILDPKQLLWFDPATGELDVLSSSRVGAGSNFSMSRHFALDNTGASLITNFSGILRVEPTTGNRTEHILLPAGSGPISTVAYDQQLDRLFLVGFFNDLYAADLTATPPILASTIKPLPPFGIGLGGAADSIYVEATSSIYAVSVSSTTVSKIDVLSGDSVPVAIDQGIFTTSLAGIDYDPATARLLVLGISGAVFSLDPATELSGVVHPPSMTATVPVTLSGARIGDGKFWSVSPNPGELRSIDLATGVQTVEAITPIGDGTPPGPMLAGRYDPVSGNFIAVAGLRIVAIDPETGSRQQLADLTGPAPFPAPPDIIVPGGIALSQDGSRAWISSVFAPKVIEVDLANGNVQEISGPGAGSGPMPDQIADIVVDPSTNLAYLADRFFQDIFRVDLTTGERVLLADLSGDLPDGLLRALELDAAANRLLINVAPSRPSSNLQPAIYSLDLATLDLTLLLDLTAVELPLLESTAPGTLRLQMSLSADRRTLFTPVNGNANIPYARIDLVSGIAESLGDASTGVPYFLPITIDVTPDDRLFALDGTGALIVIDPETGERAIISK